jgi:hypothetical protein
LFSIFGWLSIIAIAALFIAHLIILLIKTVDEIPGYWKYLPYLAIFISYPLMRTLFYFFPIEYLESISLFIMIISALVIVLILLKYKTNKFKTATKMKQLRVEDGAKRSIRK